MVGVTDGDTITVLHNGKGERIRLHGIDSREKRQPFVKQRRQEKTTMKPLPISRDCVRAEPGSL